MAAWQAGDGTLANLALDPALGRLAFALEVGEYGAAAVPGCSCPDDGSCEVRRALEDAITKIQDLLTREIGSHP